MPFIAIAWINEILLEAQEPFTVAEIATNLQQLYSASITLDAVYRAFHSLAGRPATSELVQPLDAYRPMLFSAESARRIARQAAHNTMPDRLMEPVRAAPAPSKSEKSLDYKDFPNSTQTKRKQSAKRRKTRLARPEAA